MKRIVAIAALIGLNACAPGQTSITVNPATGLPVISGGPADALASLGKFTVADINNALALAQAATPPDTDAIQCFSYLGPYVAQLQATLNQPGLTVSGAFSTFEAGRIAISKGQSIANSGLPAALNTACAPLVLDAVTTVNQLAIKLGGSAILGSVGIPSLPIPLGAKGGAAGVNGSLGGK